MFLVKQESNSNSKLSGSASQFLEPFRFENLINSVSAAKTKASKRCSPMHRAMGSVQQHNKHEKSKNGAGEERGKRLEKRRQWLLSVKSLSLLLLPASA